MLVGIAQEPHLQRWQCANLSGFNPCVSRNSSGARPQGGTLERGFCFNPCVSRNSSGAAGTAAGNTPAGQVSIRVLVGIAQEQALRTGTMQEST